MTETRGPEVFSTQRKFHCLFKGRDSTLRVAPFRILCRLDGPARMHLCKQERSSRNKESHIAIQITMERSHAHTETGRAGRAIEQGQAYLSAMTSHPRQKYSIWRKRWKTATPRASAAAGNPPAYSTGPSREFLPNQIPATTTPQRQDLYSAVKKPPTSHHTQGQPACSAARDSQDGVRAPGQAPWPQGVQVLGRRSLARLEIRPQALLHERGHQVFSHVDGAQPDHPHWLQLRRRQLLHAAVVQPDPRPGLPDMGLLQLGDRSFLVPDL